MSLLKKALTGDVTACIFYLSNRSPDRWKRNGQEIEIQVNSKQEEEEKRWELEDVIRTYIEAKDIVEGDLGTTKREEN